VVVGVHFAVQMLTSHEFSFATVTSGAA
jgi:hypothetical protein